MVALTSISKTRRLATIGIGLTAAYVIAARLGFQVAFLAEQVTIFLDIGMPGMDGYETCRCIRREPFGEGVLIVALTGWGQERDKQRATEAGFDAHFTKPVDPRKLERLLTRPIPVTGVCEI